MRALLLAAGLGTRLQPITKDIPKCLVPINGKPLVDYWLEQLFQVGVERILINTHYLAQQVEEHISKSPYSCKVDLIYEKELLMTGGTILANHDFFLGEAFMVVHADNFSICDFAKFIDTHTYRRSNVKITMMIFETDDPKSCGIIELDDHGIVRKFHEKKESPPSNLANAAVYIMENDVVDVIKKIGKKKPDISLDVIPHYLGKIGVFLNDQYHRDIGSVESYSMAQIESYFFLKSISYDF